MTDPRAVPPDFEPGLVSVVIPTYNRAALIVQALDSVNAQTYRPIEVIVVDDGSADDTQAVVSGWTASHCHESGPLTLQFLSQSNAGPSAARNRGLLVSAGEFIQFLDSDDLLHPDKLTAQIAAMQTAGAPYCVCNYKWFVDDRHDSGATVDLCSRSHRVDDFPAVYPMKTPAPLYRRSVLVRAGLWDEHMNAGEDFEYNFRVVARCGEGVWLDRVLMYARKHDSAERIQAQPLKRRYASMYHGLAAMEIEAVEQGICSPRFQASLAQRAIAYSRALQAEGSGDEAAIFVRFALARLGPGGRMMYALRHKLYVPFCDRFCPGGVSALFRRIRHR